MALSPLSVTPKLHWPFWLSPEASPALLAVPQGGREKRDTAWTLSLSLQGLGLFATLTPRAHGSTAWLPGPAASFEPFPRLGCPPGGMQPATVACRTELQPSTK